MPVVQQCRSDVTVEAMLSKCTTRHPQTPSSPFPSQVIKECEPCPDPQPNPEPPCDSIRQPIINQQAMMQPAYHPPTFVVYPDVSVPTNTRTQPTSQ